MYGSLSLVLCKPNGLALLFSFRFPWNERPERWREVRAAAKLKSPGRQRPLGPVSDRIPKQRLHPPSMPLRVRSCVVHIVPPPQRALLRHRSQVSGSCRHSIELSLFFFDERTEASRTIGYRCDNRRFLLSTHNCQVPTPTSQNLEIEQQIRIFGAD